MSGDSQATGWHRKMSEQLRHKFATLHQSLVHGKLPRNLHWSDVVDLIGHLGQMQSHGGDEFVFVVGARHEFFKRPHTSEMRVEDVSRLRQFLKLAGSESSADDSAPVRRMVVVIDHHMAHIFSHLRESGTRPAVTITPYDPYHFHHHLVHRKEAHYRGDRVPEEASFYEEVAAALATGDEIVLVGHGTGKSSAVNILRDYLKDRHIDLLRRVKAAEVSDISALTEPEIEAIARRHLIAPA
jgi:hypothetical protein